MSRSRRPNRTRKILKKKKQELEIEEIDEVGMDSYDTVKVPTQKELSKTVDRILEANDPNAPDNICRYNFLEMRYKPDPNVEQMAIHYSSDSYLIPEKGEEARFQAEAREKKEKDRAEQLKEGRRTLNNQFNCSKRATQTFVNEMKSVKEQTEDPATKTFEATATTWEIYDCYMEHFKQEATTTSKQKKKGKDDEEEEHIASNQQKEMKNAKMRTNLEVLCSEKMKTTLKIAERMVNQNTHSELLADFKFWDDESDEFKDKGTLLPLWRFSFNTTATNFSRSNLMKSATKASSSAVKKTLKPETSVQEIGDLKATGSGSNLTSPTPKTIGSTKKKQRRRKRKQVTALCWSPKYADFFAVGYGSYDFLKQGNGIVCCYSLKNPSFHEFQFTTPFGVTCLDFHSKFPSLLVIGTYDGVVAIYDIKLKSSVPIAKSDVKNGKHTDPVWSVKWIQDSTELEFHSISSDGRVTFWSMSKNELQFYDVMKLRIDNMVDNMVDVDISGSKEKKSKKSLVGQTISGLASGICFDFHSKNPNIFLVGTEEGTIHKCSKAYNSQYLFTYEGHNMSVYSVKWNKFNDDLFLSASADWTVKIWNKHQYKPLQSFDLQSSVGDISWAPYSAAVFGAVTNDGRVHIYDLNKNKNDALCDQLIVKRAKLTHIEFNEEEPIILVGDDKGEVQILKLSPKLRKKTDKIHPII